ncbi:hypothetical protein HDU96_010170, partial [Phlyctochytrium bullatum]
MLGQEHYRPNEEAVVEWMPGFSTRPIKCQGNIGSGTAYLTFDNVMIPKSNLIGEENKGFRPTNAEPLASSSLSLNGVIRNRLAHMARQIEATQAWMEYLVFQLQNTPHKEASLKFGGPIALLKAQSTQTLEYCAREASQILGGIA